MPEDESESEDADEEEEPKCWLDGLVAEGILGGCGCCVSVRAGERDDGGLCGQR